MPCSAAVPGPAASSASCSCVAACHHFTPPPLLRLPQHPAQQHTAPAAIADQPQPLTLLTPRCCSFHGIQPSKTTREKRARQAEEQLQQKRVATGEGEAETVAHMKTVQQKAATPYVVLSGTIKPGQSRDAASGYATVDRAEELEAATPLLGKLGAGGQTPLLGNAKVEAMLGISGSGGKRPGSAAGSMGPPAPKAPRRG